MIGHFLSIELLCRFSKVIRNVGIIGDQAGQLGKSGGILDGKEDEWSDLKFRASMW
jgi:hypothetical protein